MNSSYGVIWRHGDNGLAHGRLELGVRSLRLVGTTTLGDIVDEVGYADLATVHVGRLPAERIAGHRTLVLERSDGDAISIAGVAEPGLIGELADRLASLQQSNVRRRAAIVVPLQPGSQEAVARLLADGPPFDLQELGFERHAVYVTGDEAVFVFEWRGGASLDALLGEAAFWERAAAWHEHLAGPPRIADVAYAWRRGDVPDVALLPPGLHAEPQ
jgi:hypothetical protein